MRPAARGIGTGAGDVRRGRGGATPAIVVEPVVDAAGARVVGGPGCVRPNDPGPPPFASGARGGSVLAAAPSAASVDSCGDTPTAGARPRATRSSSMRMTSCSAGARSRKSAGSQSGPSPSRARAWSMAAMALVSQAGASGPWLSSAVHVDGKSGTGGMFSSAPGEAGVVAAGAAGAAGASTGCGGGGRDMRGVLGGGAGEVSAGASSVPRRCGAKRDGAPSSLVVLAPGCWARYAGLVAGPVGRAMARTATTPLPMPAALPAARSTRSNPAVRNTLPLVLTPLIVVGIGTYRAFP